MLAVLQWGFVSDCLDSQVQVKALLLFLFRVKQCCAECYLQDWSSSREERDRFSSAGIIKSNFSKDVCFYIFNKVTMSCHFPEDVVI